MAGVIILACTKLQDFEYLHWLLVNSAGDAGDSGSGAQEENIKNVEGRKSDLSITRTATAT